MTEKLKLALAFAIFFSVFSIPIIDTDFGWHYRCGKMIVREGKLCTTNRLTTLLAGYQWYSPSHGYQVLLYSLYDLFGFLGISLFYGLSAALVFSLFLKSLPGDFWLKLTLLLSLLWFSWTTLALGFRSQITSLYFFALFLAIIEVAETKPQYLLLAVPLMLSWSNFHPGFFLGVVLLISLNLKYLLPYLGKKIKRRFFLRVVAVSLLAILATFINPSGYHIYQEVWRHSQVPLNTLIAEWVAPLSRQSLLIVALSLIIFVLLVLQKPRDVFRIVLLVLTAFLALQARRNLPLFSLAATFALTARPLAEPLSQAFKKITQPTFLALFFSLLALYTSLNNFKPSLAFSEEEYCRQALVPPPCAAASFLNSQKPGNIFNTYEWGGYLAWKLPAFKTFVDGRMPSWDSKNETSLPPGWRGKSPYTIYLETLQNQPGWQEILETYKIDYLLIQPGTFMDLLLEKNPTEFGFQEIYNDGVAVIYKKSKL